MAKLKIKPEATKKPADAQAPGAALALSDEEKAQLTALEKNLERTKLALADSDAVVARATRAHEETRQRVEQATGSLRERVFALITDRGGKVDGSESWHYDATTQTLSRS